MKRRTISALCAVGLAAAVVACAGWHMRGSSQYKGGKPAAPIATYTAPKCTQVADGTALQGTAATYYLAQAKKGLTLIELNQLGEGVEIDNYWADENGHNFVTYIPKGQGFHFVLPTDPQLPGKRLVFAGERYSTKRLKGSMRIVGEPVAECEMVVGEGGAAGTPVGTAHSDRPDAAAAASRVCVPGQTQECVGPAACRGGQTCLPDGTGFSPCDCGGSGAESETSSEDAGAGKKK